MPNFSSLCGADQQFCTAAYNAYTIAMNAGAVYMSSKGLNGDADGAVGFNAFNLLVAVGVLGTPFTPSPTMPDTQAQQVAEVQGSWIPGDSSLSTLQTNLAAALLAEF